MIPVTPRTGVPHAAFVLLDRHGEEELLLVAKATFAFDARGALSVAPEQDAIVPFDRHWGDPGQSSVRYESDLAARKGAVDLVVNGVACAPQGRAVTQLVVEMRTRHFTKRALVTGDRRWRSGLAGVKPGAPAPFATMPLVYERAFGGVDVRGDRVARHGAETRNLVGVGFHSTGEPQEDDLLPNVEDVEQPQKDWKDRCTPVGFGAVYRAWQPRAGYTGTYDARWLADQFPLLPHDFDDRHYQCAPADQWLPALEPGEPVLLKNFTPEGELRLELPAFRIPVFLRRDRQATRLDITCDTCLIETAPPRLIMTGRVCVPLGRKSERLKEAIVGSLSPGEERAVLAGKRHVRLAPRPSGPSQGTP